MADLHKALTTLDCSGDTEKKDIIKKIRDYIEQANYKIIDEDITKPWGAYFRLDGNQADKFTTEFFPGLNPEEARLGNPNAELSPKILLVAPEQRLSWQYHHERAERWAFLTDGGYHKSLSDDQGNLQYAHEGDIVQFATGERHRLAGVIGQWTLVAEIWQHTNPEIPSNEADIVRLADDYSRS